LQEKIVRVRGKKEARVEGEEGAKGVAGNGPNF
jgi:hypothetical protein